MKTFGTHCKWVFLQTILNQLFTMSPNQFLLDLVTFTEEKSLGEILCSVLTLFNVEKAIIVTSINLYRQKFKLYFGMIVPL